MPIKKQKAAANPFSALSELTAISPVDGRYRTAALPLAAHFSEAAVIRRRAQLELQWLAHLCRHTPLAPAAAARGVLALAEQPLSLGDIKKIKGIENKIRHDVKALEIFLAAKLRAKKMARLAPLLHFGCTSWDINNLAVSLSLHAARDEVMLPAARVLEKDLRTRARRYASMPMLARTHGQPASPTTVGKEFSVFAKRLQSQARELAARRLPGKFNSATGNYGAFIAARPDVNWEKVCRAFVESLGLRFSTHTTQIESYDDTAAMFDNYRRINAVLLDLCRDLWGYVALDYFAQEARSGEVGSSVMPHKINPEDFETAEGNLGVANALFGHFSEKLPVSRWQRDLSDSTVLRNFGAALAHSILAWGKIAHGLSRLAPNKKKLAADLDANWQVLADAVQTALRAAGDDKAYDRLKAFTRGAANFSPAQMQAFINGLPLDDDARRRLLKLTPQNYTGLAAQLARRC